MPFVTRFGCNMQMYGFKEEDIVDGNVVWANRQLVQFIPMIIPVIRTDYTIPTNQIISGAGFANDDPVLATYLNTLTWGSDIYKDATIFMTFTPSGSAASIGAQKIKYDILIDDMRELYNNVVDLMNDFAMLGFVRFAVWDGVRGHNAFSANTVSPNTTQRWINTETGASTDAGNDFFPCYCPNFQGRNFNSGFWYATVDPNSQFQYVKTFYSLAPYASSPWFLGVSLHTAFNGHAVTDMSFFSGMIQNFDPEAEEQYINIDNSEPTGIETTHNRLGDEIPLAEIPEVSALDTGFVTLYCPTSISTIRDLATYMWDNSLFDVDNWKKIFADPMDAILGLSLVPVPITSSGSAAVSIGNIMTPIVMPKVSNQWVRVDCGSVKVNRYLNSYLDYDPYTQVEIYLPYIGVKTLRADDVMNATIKVVYLVDLISGACVAEISSSAVSRGSSVLYHFTGMCSCQIPVTGNSFDNVFNGLTKLIGGATAGIASIGLGNPLGMIAGVGTAAAGMVEINKPHIERGNGAGSTAGFLSTQKPYLIFTSPRICKPSSQQTYTGYPSFITEDLSATDSNGNYIVKGYTEIEKIHLEGFTGTETELQELEKLLKEGVIL